MAESKYSRYIITDVKMDVDLPSYRGEAGHVPDDSRKMPTRLMWLDSSIIPGAFYSETVVVWPACAGERRAAEEHTHDFTEIIGFFGTNFEDPHDLCGEIELWLEGEKHVMTRSFLAYIPAGMKHCPLIARRIEKPIMHFTMSPSKQYS
jgi:hypothetical protein